MDVVLIAAQSLDGCITRHEEPGSAFTSPEDKAHFSKSLRQFPVRVMGSTTYDSMREVFRRVATATQRHFVLTRRPDAYAADRIPGAMEFTSEAPAELVARLRAAGETRCALVGGSKVHSSFLAAGLVTELWLTIEARLFGRGTRLFAEKTDTALELLATEHLSPNTLLLKYRIASR
jgi:dihydrofolate reductase